MAESAQKQKARSAAYYRANRERILAHQAHLRRSDPNFVIRMARRTAEWQAQNRQRVRALQRAWKLKNARHYKQRNMLSSARRRAAERGLEFNLELVDVAIPALCPVFGVPFYLGSGKHDQCPSLDRIDNRCGYVKGNVVVVSELANRMKSNATIAQIQMLADFYTRIGGEANGS